MYRAGFEMQRSLSILVLHLQISPETRDRLLCNADTYTVGPASHSEYSRNLFWYPIRQRAPFF